MIVPARAWLAGAALLALLAPLALWWPAATALWLALDVLWVMLLVIDGWRASSVGIADLEVTRVTPPALSVGRAMPVEYHWRSLVHREVHLSIVEEVPSQLQLTGSGARAITLLPDVVRRETFTVVPVARGRITGGRLHLRVRSPLGLAWRQLRLELPWRVMVYPRLTGAALRALPTQAERRREAGVRSMRRLGEGRAFESLREWVPGDDTRTIDWKATARRGKVMARQYEDERRQHVMMVIDAGRMLTAEADGRPRLEAVVEAALQLAQAATSHDDNIGLLVFNDQVQQYVAPARGRRALRTVLDALATVEGQLVEPDYPGAFAWLAQRSRRRALTVVFTDVIDRTASDALLMNLASLRPRHLPLTVAMRDPALDRLATTRPTTPFAAFERAAAEELLQSREGALAEVRRGGVLVVDVAPAGAASAVVEQYHQLKRRGVL